jgi:hypothetical protein
MTGEAQWMRLPFFISLWDKEIDLAHPTLGDNIDIVRKAVF